MQESISQKSKFNVFSLLGLLLSIYIIWGVVFSFVFPLVFAGFDNTFEGTDYLAGIFQFINPISHLTYILARVINYSDNDTDTPFLLIIMILPIFGVILASLGVWFDKQKQKQPNRGWLALKISLVTLLPLLVYLFVSVYNRIFS